MKKGFSLVEILVSIAIIGIISSIGIQGLIASRERARLEEDVAKVVQAIRNAQNSALAPSRTETGVAATKTLCAIGVNINSSNGKVQPIYTSRTNSGACTESNYPSSDTLNYATVDADATFLFSIPFATTSEDSVKLSREGVDKTITVTNTGLIKVEE